ncbi:MAG: glycosyltransferase family 2 protein, partial [Nitrospiraceae bacterium]|nr:glycosyltransferase family 2 protein [Nitrospiraceae bacterium]
GAFHSVLFGFMASSAVKVTLGLPVYNGENYLVAAIESILSQTFSHFELIISDNGSQDGTQSICQKYAAQDPRIRYIRHDTNRGAAANFNYCVELATGEYFKWAAHDDIMEPTFLQKCVDQLDSDPELILCHTVTELIDANGDHLAFYDPSVLGTGKARPSDRLAGRLSTAWCKEVFGVIRLDKLRETVLLGSYVASDQALLAELALWGRFAILPEPLFKNREHQERSTRTAHPYLRLPWFTTSQNRSTRAFRWKLIKTVTRLVARRVPDINERLRCYWWLLHALIIRGWAVLLVLEPLFVSQPTWFEKFHRGMRMLRPNRSSTVVPHSIPKVRE